MQDVPPAYDTAISTWGPYGIGNDNMELADETIRCFHCGTSISVLGMANFSFNKPLDACPTCMGLGTLQQADLNRLADEYQSILEGAILGWKDTFHMMYYTSCLQAAAAHYGFRFNFTHPVDASTPQQRNLLCYGVESPLFQRHFPEIKPPTSVRQGHFEEVATYMVRRYAERIQDTEYREKDVLDRALRLELYGVSELPGDFDGLEGFEGI